jgi:hypothetical protein
MNSDNPRRWIKEELFPKLPLNIIFVAGGAYYNIRPTSSSRKKGTEDLLLEHNKSFSSD